MERMRRGGAVAAMAITSVTAVKKLTKAGLERKNGVETLNIYREREGDLCNFLTGWNMKRGDEDMGMAKLDDHACTYMITLS